MEYQPQILESIYSKDELKHLKIALDTVPKGDKKMIEHLRQKYVIPAISEPHAAIENIIIRSVVEGLKKQILNNIRIIYKGGMQTFEAKLAYMLNFTWLYNLYLAKGTLDIEDMIEKAEDENLDESEEEKEGQPSNN